MNKEDRFKTSPNFTRMTTTWYSKKWFTVSLHVLCWALFFTYPYLLQALLDDNGGGGPHPPRSPHFNYLHFLNNLVRMGLFYLNAHLLTPRLIYRRKIALYVLVILAAVAVSMLIDRGLFYWLIDSHNYRWWNAFAFHLPVIIFVIIASAGYRVVKDRVEDAQRNKERETENLKTELSFLRSQVSPHFMFNVLNNMVALARKKSDLLEPSLMKLSRLLRYMLYESDEDKVLLEKEVEYLHNYIDLQQQRFGKSVNIHTHFNPIDRSYTIAPMLLIPFVENAFKHGVGLLEQAEINIRLEAVGGRLKFDMRNRYQDDPNRTADKTSGIGLNNVRRRLQLLYPAAHQLQINKEHGWFNISLEITL